VIGGEPARLRWLAGGDDDPQGIYLPKRRLPGLAAARAIAEIEGVVAQRSAVDRGARRQLRQVVDSVRTDVPGIVSIEMARASLSLSLPGEQGQEARRILVWDQAARQLGLAAQVEAVDIEAALIVALERWRGLVNSGRVPFSARPVADVVLSQLERLWLDVTDAAP